MSNLKGKPPAMRDGVGEALAELGKLNPRVVVLSADLAESTRAMKFGKLFPERFFQVGIAEQNMMGLAAGLALSGKVPFVASFAVFNPGRNWDQFRVSVCYSETNVKVIGSHAGFSNGGDGGTHQALEDLAITRCLPNLVVLSPADAAQAKKAVLAAAKHEGPVYIRISRDGSPVVTENLEFEIGKAQLLRVGQDVTIVATGLMVAVALEAAEKLIAQKIICEVINLHTIKPLDVKSLKKSVLKTGALLTIEEHQLAGGMASAVLEGLASENAVPPLTKMMGVQDAFGESGDPAAIRAKHGLDVENVVKNVEELIKQKRK